MSSFRVSQAWQASYADPITVREGDVLTLTGRTDLWEGHLWLWARNPTGQEGWIPDRLVAQDGETARAAFDYSAQELTCEAGAIVSGTWHLNGWIWCRRADGAEGWVPEKHLAPC
ncbi:SH3 domain-containing protein [Affinirhizobium pseudoryzae]|uniref:SH3 domain-containing protein n=1 Tax=Allorhizobium pseudoryzae TaxID=379684 RepID=UPI0013EB5EDC|nr:SH3 domain-containing protein [Allorhizobium pseudoryzae]